MTRVVENPHRKAAAAACHPLPDVSEPIKAEGLRVNVPPVEQIELPAVPAALPDVSVAFDHAPRHGEQQGKRQVGRSFLKRSGRARHRDAARGAGGEVQIVVADAGIRNGAKLRRLLKDSRGDARAGHEQAFDIAYGSKQLFFWQRPVFLVGADLTARSEQVQRRLGEFSGDVNLRFHNWTGSQRRLWAERYAASITALTTAPSA